MVGVAGISRDLETPAHAADADDLFHAVELIRSDPVEARTVEIIARQVGLSAYQLNRRLKELLGITARQFRQSTGLTPRQYREPHRRSTSSRLPT